MIETESISRFSRTFDEIRPSAMLNHREFAGKTERPRRGRRWIIKSADEPISLIAPTSDQIGPARFGRIDRSRLSER
jgi:hypothetical protein